MVLAINFFSLQFIEAIESAKVFIKSLRLSLTICVFDESVYSIAVAIK